MPKENYYPRTNDGRADWWQNVLDHAGVVLTSLGFSAAEIASITNDAAWGVYGYRTVRQAFDEFVRSIYRYADEIAHGTPNGNLPVQPVTPDFPSAPKADVAADFETRRERWVQQVKKSPGYNATIGATLRLESTAQTVNKGIYQCDLSGLTALAAHTVGGRFRKSNGLVEGINLYGRQLGATAWTLLGRHTVSPFTANVPLAGNAPEQWEFMARAVSRDVEFGLDSNVIELIVRP